MTTGHPLRVKVPKVLLFPLLVLYSVLDLFSKIPNLGTFGIFTKTASTEYQNLQK
jgi:hypothetical protein